MNTTAHQIATRTTAEFTDMAHTWEHTTDMDGDTRRRLTSTLRTGTARATGPRTVTATVSGPNAHIWGYTASDALDAASSDFDDVFATGHITQTGPASWQLTW
ncbi:hypothetical protein [Nocardiopsis sp. LOL_012]|uniref:hypothetical protein n=1 Tax=Nocardiopsis sp. LOL_012 TaxID=3345409 RepID=UPI003A8BC83C